MGERRLSREAFKLKSAVVNEVVLVGLLGATVNFETVSLSHVLSCRAAFFLIEHFRRIQGDLLVSVCKCTLFIMNATVAIWNIALKMIQLSECRPTCLECAKLHPQRKWRNPWWWWWPVNWTQLSGPLFWCGLQVLICIISWAVLRVWSAKIGKSSLTPMEMSKTLFSLVETSSLLQAYLKRCDGGKFAWN